MIWDQLVGSISVPKVLLPPQHYSFLFLPSLWLTIYFLSHGWDKGWTWVCICGTDTCECHVASCTSLKMSRAITDPGPLAQTLLLEVRAIGTLPRAFHSPGLWAFTSKPHSVTSQFSPFSSPELLLKVRTTGTSWWPLCFSGGPHRLKAQKITQKGAERWISFGLRNCFF